jgi:hypothetical protein
VGGLFAFGSDLVAYFFWGYQVYFSKPEGHAAPVFRLRSIVRIPEAIASPATGKGG